MNTHRKARALQVIGFVVFGLASVGLRPLDPVSVIVPPGSTPLLTAPPERPVGAGVDPRTIVLSEATLPTRLVLHHKLSGPVALEAAELIPADQAGFMDAALAAFGRADDDSPFDTGHQFDGSAAPRFFERNGQYGTLAVVFETIAHAEAAFEAANTVLGSPAGWAAETDDPLAPGVSEPPGAARYVQGEDYGYPLLRVYLWRVDNIVLAAVDLHVYDLPQLLPSVVREMDLRAR